MTILTKFKNNLLGLMALFSIPNYVADKPKKF